MELGFKSSVVATVLWGLFLIVNGTLNLIWSEGEEEVVARFGPHYRQPNQILNGIVSFFFGTPASFNQSYAGSYAMIVRCIYGCDILFGSFTVCILAPLYLVLFFKEHWKGVQTSASSLKARVKLWLFMGVVMFISYAGAFCADAGNILRFLPKDSADSALQIILWHALFMSVPASSLILGFLYYLHLHRSKGGKDGSAVHYRKEAWWSFSSWGCHISYIILMVGYTLFHYSFILVFLGWIFGQ